MRNNVNMSFDAKPGNVPEFRDPPQPPNWVKDLIAALVVIGLAFAQEPPFEYTPPTVTAIGASVVAAAILPLRRRWPITLFAITTTMFAAVALVDQTINMGLEFAIAITLFGIGIRRDLKTVLIATLIGIVVTVAAVTVITGSVFDPRGASHLHSRVCGCSR